MEKSLSMALVTLDVFFVQNNTYSDRYDDASATWVVISAILMFFMVSVLHSF